VFVHHVAKLADDTVAVVVTTWTIMPTPPAVTLEVHFLVLFAFSCPVRAPGGSMLSLGMFSFLAARMAVRRRGLESGSPPPRERQW